MTRTLGWLTAVALLAAGPLCAQEDSLAAPTPAPTGYRNRLLALPYVSYSPQTKLQFGVGGGLQFKWSGVATDSGTRASYLAASAAFTTKGQWVTSLGVSLYLPTNRWWVAGGVAAGFFPATYYGIGSRSRVADGMLLEQHFLAGDARVYLPLRRGRDVIALALYGQWNGSRVPIQSMAMLGGFTTQELMRGVYFGRFRDRNEVVAQADYRGHAIWRFGYVVYGSAGNVYGSAGSGLFDNFKFTYGAGLRFNINQRDPLNLRADYTLTSFGSRGLSLGAAEAF